MISTDFRCFLLAFYCFFNNIYGFLLTFSTFYWLSTNFILTPTTDCAFVLDQLESFQIIWPKISRFGFWEPPLFGDQTIRWQFKFQFQCENNAKKIIWILEQCVTFINSKIIRVLELFCRKRGLKEKNAWRRKSWSPSCSRIQTFATRLHLAPWTFFLAPSSCAFHLLPCFVNLAHQYWDGQIFSQASCALDS